eukprot:9227386-Pyramimonas_sp.AAC.1
MFTGTWDAFAKRQSVPGSKGAVDPLRHDPQTCHLFLEAFRSHKCDARVVSDALGLDVDWTRPWQLHLGRSGGVSSEYHAAKGHPNNQATKQRKKLWWAVSPQ